jgi:putative FmdB family regulatory protein
MPLYDYKCEECSKTFSHLSGKGTPPICPNCWSQKVAKQLPKVRANFGAAGPTESDATEQTHQCTSSCSHEADSASDSKDHQDHNHGPSEPCAGSQAERLKEKYLK